VDFAVPCLVIDPFIHPISFQVLLYHFDITLFEINKFSFLKKKLFIRLHLLEPFSSPILEF